MSNRGNVEPVSTGQRLRALLSVLVAVLIAAGTMIGLQVAPAQAADGGSMATISGKISAPEGRTHGSTRYVHAYTPDGEKVADVFFGLDGRYSLNVVPGEYKLKIISDSPLRDSTSPTQWYKAGGNVGNRADADVVTVPGSGLTVDTTLDAGTMISGTVSAPAGRTFVSNERHVHVYTLGGDYAGDARFGSDGRYSLNVVPGDYKLKIRSIVFPIQWYKAGGNVGKRADADVVTVPGSGLTVDTTLDAGTMISGTVSAPEGLLLGRWGYFSVYTASGVSSDGRADFKSDGRYSLNVMPGAYKLQIDSSDFPRQWYSADGNVRDEADAGVVTVPRSGLVLDTTLADMAISGTISAPDGRSLGSGRHVRAFKTNGSLVDVVSFNADGGYTLQVMPGEYKLQIDVSGFPAQWYSADGNVKDEVDADVVTVPEAGLGLDIPLVDTFSGGVPVAPTPVPVSIPAAPAPALVAPVAPPAPAPAPAAPAPAPAPAPVAQAPAGGVPSAAKVKGKGMKAVKLPTRTNAGQAVKWLSATPKVCKVVKGKLKLTGKKGMCRLTGAAPATGGFGALRQSYAIRVK